MNKLVCGAWNKAYDEGTRKAIVQVRDDVEKWHFKMDWCRKAGVSPCNDLYWKLAELAYVQRYSENPRCQTK